MTVLLFLSYNSSLGYSSKVRALDKNNNADNSTEQESGCRMRLSTSYPHLSFKTT